MSRATHLRAVSQDAPERISIAAQWRAESNARDWGKVHIEADKREPVQLRLQRWFFS